MVPVKIDIPGEFFKEEIRNDYLVTTKMKKVWAVQIDLLSELERVCKKHNLKYFADSGTLIGAVRHKGYIPWDDDIDIVMLRKDYNKLLHIAADEFSAPYFFQSVLSEEKFVRGYSRLRNSETTCIVSSDVGKGYNSGIFIDIFPLDHIPDNKMVFMIWKKMIFIITRFLKTWAYSDLQQELTILRRIKRWLFTNVVNWIGVNKVYSYFEKLCGRYNNRRTKRLSYVAYSYGKSKHLWDRRCFFGSYRVPFEFTEIDIPSGYDSRLKVEYGDYMELRKAPTAHGSCIFEPEISYVDYMKDHSEDEIRSTLQNLKEGI